MQHLQVRKAVGLGGMALDPLAVISTLLGRRKELLSLQLHDLQAKLPQELLASRLEQVGCCAVRLLCQCVVIQNNMLHTLCLRFSWHGLTVSTLWLDACHLDDMEYVFYLSLSTFLCSQTLISAVAQVGVDLNAMAANTWRQAPLQFVPGLGPRKARSLLAAVAANDNHVKTRVDLLRPNVSCFLVVSCQV